MPSLQTDSSNSAWVARKLTSEEKVILKVAEDSIKETIPTLQEMLGRFITLDTALIGGGFALVKSEVIAREIAVTSVLFFLASLAFALWGVWPVKWTFRFAVLHEVKKFDADIKSRKTIAVSGSGVLLILGLIIAVIGLIVPK